MRKKLGILAAAVMMLTVMTATPAFAHFCFVANKKPGAGSGATVNIDTGEYTPTKKNGGGAFTTVTGEREDGSTFSYDVFAKKTLPEGARSSGPEGDNQCDGRGVDDALACEGLEEE